MERIMVIGVSAGAGKSTFARRLGGVMDLPVHHLDAHFWKPGWVESEEKEFRQRQEELVKSERWVIEGNYSSSMDIRLHACDGLIQLELPLWLCLWRVLKRRIQYRNKTRPDMAPGCPEKLDFAFLKFIVTTYYGRRESHRLMVQRLLSENPEKAVHVLRHPREIERFLQQIGK